MKLPNVPWKNIAAIGRRSQRISMVRIRPMPPCCSAMLDIPSLKFSPISVPVNVLPQKANATLDTIFIAMPVTSMDRNIRARHKPAT